jgi:hypothetical protein
VAIVNGYATLSEVKAELRLTTTVDDPRLERAIEASSRAIDNTTSRQFFTTTGAVIYRSWGATVWFDDAQAPFTLVRESRDQTNWTTVPSTSYVSNPRAPFRRLRRTTGDDWLEFVEITPTAWGTATIPTEIHQACIIQAIRFFKRSDSPGGVLTGDFGAARLARIDPDVLALIRPLSRKIVG